MRLPNLSPQPVAAVASPRGLDATYLSRRAFLTQATVGSERCSFLVPNVAVAPGTPVQVHVRFADQVMAFDVSGTVARSVGAEGAQVEVSGAELHAFGRVYAFSRGLPLAWGRRASERFEVSLAVELGAADGPLVRGRLLDLSRGGARVQVPAGRFRAGQPVRFMARLGLVKRLRGLGRVAWSTSRAGGLSLGLGFDAMDTADRLALGAFLLDRRGIR